jgi:phosphoribosylanthranilate isomerase
MVRVKICGITRPKDALAAEAAGADAVGLIFWPRSKRRVSVEQARAISDGLGPFVARVGVFLDAPFEEVLETALALRLDAVQLHGREEAEYAARLRERVRVIKAFAYAPSLTPEVLAAYPADAVLLDAPVPGGGRAFDWGVAERFRGFPRLILAGGLTPENVAAGVAAFAPYGVDVASGVEEAPGVKSAAKLRAFVRALEATGRGEVLS